jgi:short subunit dehydrogenase-like uncharacterized protein
MSGGVLLYGANGYTGRLILDTALREGVPIAIAGRRREAIVPLAQEKRVPCVVFELEDRAASVSALSSFRALLLASGPFAETSAPALDACLESRTHYIDITGEVPVFESLFAREAEAKAAGIAVLPGAGFDVVPTDCLAALLASALPGARRLLLAFRGFRPSPGTAKTMLRGIGEGGLARIDGRLAPVPTAWKTREVPFRDRSRTAMTVPWGDLSTAYRSTGIPEIETYVAASPAAIRRARRLARIVPLLSWKPLSRLIERSIAARVAGPSADDRERERSQIWGRVETSDGRFVEGRVTTLEGYAFTAESAVACAREILSGSLAPGVWTPSRAFGADFLRGLPSTIVEVPSASGAGAST